jgi:hypothetical protein
MPGHELILHPLRPRCISLRVLADAADMHPDLVGQFVTYGLLEPVSQEPNSSWFDAGDVLRLRMIGRLRNELGINLPGVAVVLDLLKRMEIAAATLR